MSSEYTDLARAEQAEAKETLIPPGVTHREQVAQVLNSVETVGCAVVTGPSRAGKSTFLHHSLDSALRANGYESPAQVDCMTALPQEAISELSLHRSAVVLDEVSRMAEDSNFITTLRGRIAARRPTVICITSFGSEGEEAELHRFMTQLGLGDQPEIVTDFPSTMTQEDAIALATEVAPNLTDDAISRLTDLTTQPYLLRLILNDAQKKVPLEADELSTIVRDVLSNHPVNQSLKPEARSLWQKVSEEPCPRWLMPGDEELDS